MLPRPVATHWAKATMRVASPLGRYVGSRNELHRCSSVGRSRRFGLKPRCDRASPLPPQRLVDRAAREEKEQRLAILDRFLLKAFVAASRHTEVEERDAENLLGDYRSWPLRDTLMKNLLRRFSTVSLTRARTDPASPRIDDLLPGRTIHQRRATDLTSNPRDPPVYSNGFKKPGSVLVMRDYGAQYIVGWGAVSRATGTRC